MPLPLKSPPLALLLEEDVSGTLPPTLGDEEGLLVGVTVEELLAAMLKAGEGVVEGEAPLERVPEEEDVGEEEGVALGVVEGDAPFDSVCVGEGVGVEDKVVVLVALGEAPAVRDDDGVAEGD